MWTFDLIVVDESLLCGDQFDSIVTILQQSQGTKVITMSRCGQDDEERGLEEILDAVKVAGTLQKPISCGQLDYVVEQALA